MTFDGPETEPAWRPARAFPALPPGEIHVWLLPDTAPCNTEACLILFNKEERERLTAMQSPAVREEFIRGRSAIRRILGYHLGMPPSQVPLVSAERGKPALALESDLHFNLSHTRGATLIALSRNGALGVDIESLARELQLRGIAKRYYAPAELRQLEEAGWSRACFFEIWTRKEACLKASGHGISMELSTLDTAVPTGQPVILILADGRQEWFVQLLPAIEGFTSALATGTPQVPVKTWRWALADWA